MLLENTHALNIMQMPKHAEPNCVLIMIIMKVDAQAMLKIAYTTKLNV